MVIDASKTVVASWGDADLPVFPRSAIKPIQALPLIESGAADAFGLGQEDIAFACASHAGEPRHVALAEKWLDRLGLQLDDLACGAHEPTADAARAALLHAGRSPFRLHNNCSGKHLGLLTATRHHGEPVKGYEKAAHPAQRRWIEALAEIAETSLDGGSGGVDGCGIPTIPMPLGVLAFAGARLSRPETLPGRWREPARQVIGAMTAHPFLVAGTDRFVTDAIGVCGGTLVAKNGAEGVYLAFMPGRGLGMAIKIEDGAPRAAQALIAALIDRYLPFGDTERQALIRYLDPPITNWAGDTVGTIRVELS